MSLDSVLLTILATITSLSALGVALTRDIVRSAVWLLFTLVGVSTIYLLLGADFVGATQLIVYVGGTMVLVVFGVMLTAQQRFLKIRTTPSEWVVGGVLSVTLLATLIRIVLTLGSEFGSSNDAVLPSAGAIGLAFMTKYLLPFEIVSVHLLVVLIGAAYLARAKRRAKEGPS